jgi:hypothetical protein
MSVSTFINAVIPGLSIRGGAMYFYPLKMVFGGGEYCFTSVRPSVRPNIFFGAFFSIIDNKNTV